MAAIFRWSGRWRSKQLLWLNLGASYFQLLLILWTVLGAVVNLLVIAQEQQTNSTVVVISTSNNNSTNKNGTSEDGEVEGSGSWEWEYYYDDDDEDGVPSNSSSVGGSSNNATSRVGKYLNSTIDHHHHHRDEEYYYYLDEQVILKPNNGSEPTKVIKTTTLKIDKSRRATTPRTATTSKKNKDDSLESASFPRGFEDGGLGHDGGGGINPLSLVEPIRKLATPIQLQGPTYTDSNYGTTDYYYQHSGPDTAVGNPLGPGEFPHNPFKEHGEPDLLRPPPPLQPVVHAPVESGINLDEFNRIKHANSIDDGVVPISENDEDDGNPVGEPVSPIDGTVFHDDAENHHLLPAPGLPNLLPTKLKVEAFGSVTSEKNPIVKAKDFFYHLWYIVSHLSKSELVLWMEKAFNVVAELSIPKEHYLRVISFAGIYLFITMLTYGSENVVELMCVIDTKDKPLKRWKYHASRRFVPARSVDPHMQQRFLKLFRGEDDDDSDEDDLSDDISGSRSSVEDIADELDHISELCPEDAFFYSLNPKHIEAYTLLQNILVAQDSPKRFLHLAKRLLHKEKVHPKAWYFAIIGAFLARQDLTGFSVAHPLDSIPDWYIPADLIDKHIKKYKKIRIKRSSVVSSLKNVTIASNAAATILFSQEQETSKEGLALKLPVKSSKENFTVTIVASKKNGNSSASNLVRPINVASSEEFSNSVEPISKEIKRRIFSKSGKNKKTTKNGSKPTTKTVNAQKLKAVGGKPGKKGDKEDLIIVKGKSGKGNSTVNEYLLDGHNRQLARHSKKGKKKKCIKVDWKVGLDNGPENELWYFRESIMMSQHHWYWHQTHPVNSTQHGDRRAELFFYMHRAFVARYNAERLAHGMKMVRPLNFRNRGVIYSGYNSHLADINSGIYWTPRWPNTPLADIYHEHDPDFAQNITLAYYNTLCRRLVKAILSGKLLLENGPPLPINHVRGIEPLINTIEAADISVNPMYYDPMGIHALGHIMVGLAADPDFRFRSATGVMSEAAVSMRDPSFYSYHKFMDDIFELHKERLPPYTVVGGEFPLLWKGVKILKVELHSQGGAPNNELRTFWTHHEFELSPGVDRSSKKGKKQPKVCSQHLDHEPFYFKIVIDRQPCVKSKSGLGTVRIFMAPRYDEKGKRIPIKLQRRLMFPLDSFTVKLKVGRNTITRYAEDSSLTQPWTKSIRDFERGPDPSGAADFCGCGWPQHLYIPKGHVAGMAFDLFVMITNYDQDYVPNDPKILEIPETCNSPYIFCGLPRRRYPDKRPMGYPFDRPLFKSLNCPPGWTFSSVVCKSVNLVINKPLDTLEQYVSKVPNMAMLKFHIRHLDTFLPEPARH